jgi:hypothetical protein
VRARVKRKSAVTFVTALFFLVAGTRISSISFRMDVKGGLNNEKLRPLRDLPFYIPIRF